MIKIRRSGERGHFDHGWLDTYHTFSFGDYHDPHYTRFKSLRVINEDRVQAGQGFGMHPHRDMEIITYVLSGELEHGDSLGNKGLIRRGEVQYMAAGSGIMHSEFNPSKTQPVHLMQIWIMPDRRGVKPHYEQRPFPGLGDSGKLVPLATADGRDGTIQINQDASMFAATLREGQKLRYELNPDRGVWVQVLSGNMEVDGNPLAAGDGASVTEQSGIELSGLSPSEILMFDLA